MYKVIERFKDKDGTVYEVGDAYEAAKRRLNQLANENNRYGRPFIQEVEDEQG